MDFTKLEVIRQEVIREYRIENYEIAVRYPPTVQGNPPDKPRQTNGDDEIAQLNQWVIDYFAMSGKLKLWI
jgi:hypothetical protein